MFTFFVFRRFGLAIPLTLMFVGFLVQYLYDNNHGPGYYSSHFTPVGLTLFVSGLLTAIISCVSTSKTRSNTSSSASSSSGKYSSLLVVDGDSSGLDNIQTTLRTKMEKFVYESSDDDSFCYAPLNRCSQVLIAVGLMVMIGGLFQ
mmetsp:Transcript_15287/g.37772  ORF Transcript_15287/g.37772 Transcript_15287/m.37772 type:complete len:146 (-) Transcript_15287:143-580(-)|eukprot:CAMPEP_0113457726 /NCGR_PEP_ID=MMETSP0014_2-20120614/9556_1 /TAXON_ID=2857 /ORGANISM="Nitzschia sp." /LENGTH=145 /DNA_ID=CAMNT_0000349229 /DNA_START=84 /DNA_END=521 /DNA_ORIENTATION=+ /assembly_acc=CAM_ASM_000159